MVCWALSLVTVGAAEARTAQVRIAEARTAGFKTTAFMDYDFAKTTDKTVAPSPMEMMVDVFIYINKMT